MSPPQFEAQLDEYEQRLTALLEVAEILSGVLDIDVLVKTIMERACSLLNAERCSFFLVDSNHQELITKFHGPMFTDTTMSEDNTDEIQTFCLDCNNVNFLFVILH